MIFYYFLIAQNTVNKTVRDFFFRDVNACIFYYFSIYWSDTSLMSRPLVKSVYQKIKFSYFSTKTYVEGAQKNRLNETVLLSTQNMLKLMGKKLFRILHQKKINLYLHLFTC